MKRCVLLIALLCILTACGAKEEPPFVKEVISYPAADSADFSLPEGYVFADETTASIIRIADNQIVGGILSTGLDADCLDEKNSNELHFYLNSLGYMCEWITMNADGFKSVGHYITDEGATDRRKTSRYLFPMNGEAYDLWFDSAVIQDEEETAIRKCVIGK